MFFFTMKVNSLAHVYLWWNLHLFLIIMHWKYFKYNDLLHTFSVYKIPGKKHLQIFEICPPNKKVSKYIPHIRVIQKVEEITDT